MENLVINSIHQGCFYPIRTPTGSYGCGYCPACRSKQCSRYTKLLKSEMDSSQDVFHILLTYDNVHLPLFYLSDEELSSILMSSSNKIGRLVRDVSQEISKCKLISSQENYQNAYDIQIKRLSCIQERSYEVNATVRARLGLKSSIDDFYKNPFPCLYYSDVQMFLKRLRMQIKRETGEVFRFFVTCEYGGKKFRPHYHLFIMRPKGSTYSARTFFEVLRTFSCKSWQNGNVYTTIFVPVGTSYFTSYFTSLSVAPVLYWSSPIRCHVRSSRFLGCSFDEKVCEFIQEVSKRAYASIFEKSILENGRVNQPNLPVSALLHSLLPRCYHYANLRSTEKYRLYNFVDTKEYEQIKKIKEQFILDLCRFPYSKMPLSFKFVNLIKFNGYPKDIKSDNLFDKYDYWCRVYSAVVCVSKKYMDNLPFFADTTDVNPYSVEFRKEYINIIDGFWYKFDMNKLRNFYEFQTNLDDASKYLGTLYPFTVGYIHDTDSSLSNKLRTEFSTIIYKQNLKKTHNYACC